MKMIRLFAVSLFLAALFAVSAFAQATAPVKIAVINTYAFGDEKAGITKYIGAVKTINTEFQPLQTELDGLNTKLNGLAKEIENLRQQASAGKVPIDEKTAQAKV